MKEKKEDLKALVSRIKERGAEKKKPLMKKAPL